RAFQLRSRSVPGGESLSRGSVHARTLKGPGLGNGIPHPSAGPRQRRSRSPAARPRRDRRDRRIQVATIATVRQKGNTLSLIEVKGSDGPRTEPCLDLEVECERPMVGPARYGLSGLEEVLIGRGAHRAARRDGAARLEVEVPDGSMSAVHVRIRRHARDWLLVAPDSHNPPWVNRPRDPLP